MVARISQDFTITPNILTHVTLGYNRDNFTYEGQRSFSHETLGIANITDASAVGLCFTGYACGSADAGQTVVENGSVVNGFVSWIKGRHELKFGGDYIKQGDTTGPISSASFSFSNLETDLPSSPNFALLGNGFASFLIGAVDGASENDFINEVGTRFKYFGFYAQDNYKATSNLTLNLGLRYDIPFTRTQVHNVFSSFDPDIPNPGAGGILGALAFAGTGPGRTGKIRFSDTRYNDFQPRVGFAYKLASKTVIRGGFGIFTGSSGDVIENGIRVQYSDGFNANPSFVSTNQGITPAFYIQSGFPAFTPPPFIQPTLDNNEAINWDAGPDGTTAMISNWNLDVQRALPAGFLVDIGYVGNSAHHLGSFLINPNQVDPKYLSLGSALTAPLSSAVGQATHVPLPYAGFTGTVAQALRPYPQYQGINEFNQSAGSSHYHSLQVKLQRQFHQGLSVLVAYTYSKLMTNSETQGSAGYSTGGQDNYNRAAEMCASGYSPPQVLNVAYVYELPFGNRKRFLNQPGVASAVLGGWAFSGIQRYQSGTPISPSAPNDLPIFNNYFRPDLVVGPSLRASWSGRFDPGKDVYLNAAAFAVPAPYKYGDAARYLPLRGFSFYNEDFSLKREFRIKESMGLEFRVDAFNIFNRVDFGGPDAGYSPSNTDFGHVGSQANAPRSVQIGARIFF
jgi:hypothetical protein